MVTIVEIVIIHHEKKGYLVHNTTKDNNFYALQKSCK